MGNFKKDSRVRQKNQAEQVLPSGGDKGRPGYGGQDIRVLRIKLVRIDKAVIKKAVIHDNVILSKADDGYYCFLSKEILGKVPANYTGDLAFRDNHQAEIVEFDEHSNVIIVEVNL